MTHSKDFTNFRHERIVQLSDTDLAGIVHFSRLAAMAEEAEHAFLQEFGVPIISESCGWAKVRLALDFRHPARFLDRLQIAVQLRAVGGKSLTYRFRILAGEAEFLVAEGDLVTCFIDFGQQPVRSREIPAALREKLAGLVVSGAEISPLDA